MGGVRQCGALAIQFVKLSGYEVLITAGISNFEYVKSLGADAFFDLRSPTVGEDIRAHTNDELYHAFDTIGEYGSPEASAKALASKEPEGQKLYFALYGAQWQVCRSAERCRFFMSLGYTAAGEAFRIRDAEFAARLDDYEFAKKWMPLTSDLLAQKKVKPHRAKVREGGFEAITSGFEDLKGGKISGVKVMYRVAEP
ncbi:zinc-binding dehydrogenase [Paraphaeosphaeria minitans]|uniref:Zinc-binding dehydrogenase n=1 Tax=Paraphaeosphaeria minitans TaxID=565426 RepID=A0A9P6KT59_9PLEO|nr:zinc-binding dehydrogenase [Paraphaeosphaeria minitans]